MGYHAFMHQKNASYEENIRKIRSLMDIMENLVNSIETKREAALLASKISNELVLENESAKRDLELKVNR